MLCATGQRPGPLTKRPPLQTKRPNVRVQPRTTRTEFIVDEKGHVLPGARSRTCARAASSQGSLHPPRHGKLTAANDAGGAAPCTGCRGERVGCPRNGPRDARGPRSRQQERRSGTQHLLWAPATSLRRRRPQEDDLVRPGGQRLRGPPPLEPVPVARGGGLTLESVFGARKRRLGHSLGSQGRRGLRSCL